MLGAAGFTGFSRVDSSLQFSHGMDEMTRPVKFVTGFVILAVILVVVATVFALHRPISPPPPLPNPNAYEALLTAGKSLPVEIDDVGKKSVEELSAANSKNQETLALAKNALEGESRVPLFYSATNLALGQQLIALRHLGTAFSAQGRQAELEQHFEQAAQIYFVIIRLGHATANGGVIIDSMIGIAIETMGLAGLERVSASLDSKQCRDLAARLENAENRRESIETILAREKDWVRRTYGFRGQIIRLVDYRQMKQTEQRWIARLKAHEVRTDRLLLQLASRAYELEKGEPPKNAKALVPEYLKAIPGQPPAGPNPIK